MYKNQKYKYNQQFINVVQPVGETFSKPSLTVPGQDITVAEIYRRYGNGSLPNVQFNSLDDETESFDNTTGYFDKIQSQEFVNNLNGAMQEIQRQVDNATREEAERMQYEALKTKFEKTAGPSNEADPTGSAS